MIDRPRYRGDGLILRPMFWAVACLSCWVLGSSAALGQTPPELPPAEARAKLDVRIEGPESVNAGQTFSCRVVISNPGDATIENGGFSLNLTRGLQLTENPNIGDGPFRLESGASIEIPLALMVSAPGVHAVRARVEADGGVRFEQTREFNVLGEEFSVALETPKRHVVGAPLKFRVYIANRRGTPAANVQCFVPIPAGVEVLTAEAGALFNRRTSTVRWRVGTLEPAEERGFRLTVKVAQPMTVSFTASAEAEDGVKGEDAASVDVTGHTALGVTMEPAEDVVLENKPLTIKFTIHNRGSQPARALSVRVNRLPAFTLDESNSRGWTQADDVWVYEGARELPASQTIETNLTLIAQGTGDALLRSAVTSEDVFGEIIRTQPVLVLGGLAPPPVAADAE